MGVQVSQWCRSMAKSISYGASRVVHFALTLTVSETFQIVYLEIVAQSHAVQLS